MYTVEDIWSKSFSSPVADSPSLFQTHTHTHADHSFGKLLQLTLLILCTVSEVCLSAFAYTFCYLILLLRVLPVSPHSMISRHDSPGQHCVCMHKLTHTHTHTHTHTQTAVATITTYAGCTRKCGAAILYVWFILRYGGYSIIWTAHRELWTHNSHPHTVEQLFATLSDTLYELKNDIIDICHVQNVLSWMDYTMDVIQHDQLYKIACFYNIVIMQCNFHCICLFG